MAAGWLSAVAGGIAERIPLVAKVPTRYTTGARTVAAIRETVGDAFDPAQPGLSRRAGGAASRVVVTASCCHRLVGLESDGDRVPARSCSRREQECPVSS